MINVGLKNKLKFNIVWFEYYRPQKRQLFNLNLSFDDAVIVIIFSTE